MRLFPVLLLLSCGTVKETDPIPSPGSTDSAEPDTAPIGTPEPVDADGDGVLTKDEMRSAHENMRREYRGDPAERFAAADAGRAFGLFELTHEPLFPKLTAATSPKAVPGLAAVADLMHCCRRLPGSPARSPRCSAVPGAFGSTAGCTASTPLRFTTENHCLQ